MKTAEPLNTDKVLQMLVDSESDVPCIAMHGSSFCDNCNVNFSDEPKKECWLRYLEMKVTKH